MAVGRLWAELWTRPGDPAYGPKNRDLPVGTGGITKRYSGVGYGSMSLPRDDPVLDDILFIDKTTPSSSVWSTIKIFAETAPSTPVFEWLPTPRVGSADKTDPSSEVTGVSVEALMAFGRLEPYDWDGSDDFASENPDWVWGGRNVLFNGDFESSQARPEINEIVVTATGGTFTLSDGTDTTSAIAYNAAAGTIETRIETDLGLISDVLVTGTGSSSDPYRIEFVTPPIFAGGLIIGVGGLTGGSATLTRVQFGALVPTGWTKSQQVSFGTPKEFGGYASFRVTTAFAHTGTYSLLIDPTTVPPRYAGAQQVVNVKPGTYQASIWIRPTSGTDLYRFVIRGIDEDFIASDTGGLGGTAYTANVWTQVTIPNVVIPDGTTQIIFRFANVNPTGNPAIFYLDDAELNEGLAPATIGVMVGDFYDAWTDPALRTPIVWDDGSATNTPYLTLDFTDTLDSGGNAWTDPALSLTWKPRMNGVQILGRAADLGYEWRVVADSVTAGTYKLQLYNPGGLGVTQGGLQAGAVDIRSDRRYFRPEATDWVIQGLNNITARDRDTGLISAFGRIEGSVLDQDITSLVDGSVAAAQQVTDTLAAGESLVYTTKAAPGQPEPFITYDVGDVIRVEDPPVTGTRRLAVLEVAWDQTGAEYSHQLGSGSSSGGLATVGAAVNAILDRFERADPELTPGTSLLVGGGGGGTPTVVVAASDATEFSKSRADFVCGGTDDHLTINAAAVAIGYGRVLLTEGGFVCGSTVSMPSGVDLIGVGSNRTVLDFFALSGTTDYITVGQGCTVADLAVQGGNYPTSTGTGIWAQTASGCRIHNVEFNQVPTCIQPGNNMIITSCNAVSTGAKDVYNGGSRSGVQIRGCLWVKPIDVAVGNYWRIVGNTIGDSISLDTGTDTIISDNTFTGINTSAPLVEVVTSYEHLIIANNIGDGGTFDGIVLESTTHVEIVGNIFDTVDNGMLLTSCAIVNIADNALSSVATAGIVLTSCTAPVDVDNNTLDTVGTHGISSTTLDDVRITNNTIRLPGQNTDNTYDGIILAGTSLRNMVHGNRIIGKASANQPRYGINISAAAVNAASYLGNRTGPATDYGTGAYNDAGTATVNTWPAAAAPQGDNLL